MKDSTDDQTLMVPINRSGIQDSLIKPWNHSDQQSAIPSFSDHLDQAFPFQKPLFNRSNIPKFMMDYFEWHGQQLKKLHSGEISWTPHIVNKGDVTNGSRNKTYHTHKSNQTEIFPRFLIMRCIQGDRCGGTSDRLKAFPLFIWLAQVSDRILFIRWGRYRPFPITEFLRPGVLWNWTVPEPMLHMLEEGDQNPRLDTTGDKSQHIVEANHYRRAYYDGTKFKLLQQSTLDQTIWVVEGNDYSGGASRYHNLVAKTVPPEGGQEDVNYTNFYHDLFHGSFLPSSAIERLLLAYVDQDYPNDSIQPVQSLPVRMQQNGYVVAHYRAKYPGEPYRQTWNVSLLEQTVLHAVNCAVRRGPSDLATVYVASDTALALQAVYSKYQLQSMNNFHVWTYLHLQPVDTEKKVHALGTVKNTSTVPFASDPPHLNFAKLDDPFGFYGIFVDLFLMSYSYCVVYGAGGFGRFGALVSYHPKCGTSFTSQNGVLQQCSSFSDV
jgi:hypothetical protein